MEKASSKTNINEYKPSKAFLRFKKARAKAKQMHLQYFRVKKSEKIVSQMEKPSKTNINGKKHQFLEIQILEKRHQYPECPPSCYNIYIYIIKRSFNNIFLTLNYINTKISLIKGYLNIYIKGI